MGGGCERFAQKLAQKRTHPSNDLPDRGTSNEPDLNHAAYRVFGVMEVSMLSTTCVHFHGTPLNLAYRDSEHPELTLRGLFRMVTRKDVPGTCTNSPKIRVRKLISLTFRRQCQRSSAKKFR